MAKTGVVNKVSISGVPNADKVKWQEMADLQHISLSMYMRNAINTYTSMLVKKMGKKG